MRACQYCAEQVQDAAIVCKHCRRDIGPSVATKSTDRPAFASSYTSVASTPASSVRPPAATPKPKRRGMWVLLLAVIAFGAYRYSQGAGRGGVVALVTPPRVIPLRTNEDIAVGPGQVRHWEWIVTPDQPTCRVTGRVEVLRGGQRDVKIAVMTLDDYQNAVNGHDADAYFRTAKTTATTLDVMTNTPGPKVLAISNTFSLFTEKHVRTTNLKVTCQ